MTDKSPNIHSLRAMYSQLLRDLDAGIFSYVEFLELGKKYEEIGRRDKANAIYKMAVRENAKRSQERKDK